MALYQPAGLSPRDMVRRQAMIFMAALALLLVVIAGGLVATYRLVRRESEIARLKSDFVANVSHDLKTPLALIRMFAETLEMDRVPDERRRREYYGVLTRESERLSRLIDNVLDFSRIESGRQRYEISAGPWSRSSTRWSRASAIRCTSRASRWTWRSSPICRTSRWTATR